MRQESRTIRQQEDITMASTVLIIRHAEKPDQDHSAVNGSGAADSKSLTPRGWQRAGVWVEMLAPSLGQPLALPKPTAIFASAPATHSEIAAGQGGSRSQRPLETVSPLAAKLGLDIDLRFGKGKEADLANAISTIAGVVLVCWQHEDIAAIAQALAPPVHGAPTHWPGDCFNVIFRFDRPTAEAAWAFRQIAPVMLDGDRSQPL
jgi:hypothetical protein